MSFSFQGLQATVTIVGGQSLPQPTSSQTLITKCIIAGNTGTTIHTVTAGKTFYCTGFVLGGNGAAAAKITVAGTDVIGFFVNATAGEGCVPLSGGILFSATAGQTIVVNWAVGAGTVNAGIWGYEV